MSWPFCQPALEKALFTKCFVWESCLQTLTLVCWFSRQSIARHNRYKTQLTGRRSQVAGRRSQVACHRSQVPGPRSQVPGPRSQVSGRMSQVAGHRSQVTENLTKKLDIYLGFLCLFVSFITDYATIRHMFAIDHAFRFCFKS